MKTNLWLSIFGIALGILLAAPVAYANNDLPPGQTPEEFMNQFGVRPATASDANQGTLTQVVPHDKGPDHTPSGEFRLPGESDSETHTEGNTCVSPQDNGSFPPDYHLATNGTLNGSHDTVIGGTPSPGSTGVIIFNMPPAQTDGSHGWGGSQNNVDHWGGNPGDVGGDTFLDGTNCATGCDASGVNTIGTPFGGSSGREITTFAPTPDGFEIITDIFILEAIGNGNIDRALELLRTNAFPGQEVVLDQFFQPYE